MTRSSQMSGPPGTTATSATTSLPDGPGPASKDGKAYVRPCGRRQRLQPPRCGGAGFSYGHFGGGYIACSRGFRLPILCFGWSRALHRALPRARAYSRSELRR